MEKQRENGADMEREEEALTRSMVRETLAEPAKTARLWRLARELRRAMRTLRRSYRRAVQCGKTAADEWLGDNYHLLLREGEGALSALRHADRQPCADGEPVTYRLFRRMLKEQGLPGAEEIRRLLDMADEERPLTVFELAQLPLCLKAALVMLAADACGAEPEQGERWMSAAVTGLRQMAELDFVAMAEEHSVVEKLLTGDPAGLYTRMDEDTRADYRRAVALKAIRQEIGEGAVAAAAVEAAATAPEGRKRHVGHWLLDEDRAARRARGRAALACTLVLPLLAAVSLAVLIGSPWAIPLLYFPLWELLRPVVEHVARMGLKPRRLPRMDLEGDVPEEGRTLITVSTLLPTADSAGKVAAHLARLYNTNGTGAVQICLLADLKQAKYPAMPQDEADIAAMTREIRRLNHYCPGSFVLAVRPRTFSPTMQSYSGWERKRGAITQLVRLIRGQEGEFLALEGDIDRLRRTKYLLALDSDTDMRMDTVSQLVGAALHPCNRPVIDPITQRVVAGYGILTPRMGVTLDSADRTPFSRVMAGQGGITAYDVVAGDLYMDGFEESIFAGKGLIDVEAFALVTEEVFPPEQVLSHDILEGSLLRTGLVSDVEMTDGVPSGMGGWLDRLHRWIRGDWQNITFLWHPALCFTRLDKWKLLDNLRRSLTPALILLCLLLSPLFERGGVLALAAILSAVSGQLLAAFLSLVHGGWLTLTGKYYSRVMPRAMGALAQAGVTFVMLPATAWVGLSGMGIALWRLKSRKRMLEWVTAAEADSRRGGFLSALRRFWYSLPAAAICLVFGGALLRLAGLFFLALIPLALWSARPAAAKKPALSAAGREQVHTYAAAMWRFYEELCTPEDHYLPPDNLQESPVWRVAHRTSPTNIGLYLLCVLAARDLGFIDVSDMLNRVENTVATVEKLEKWKGNLLNWYDTRTLRPLSPRYVSTVDSGNLACCLVALRQGLLELRDPRGEELAARIRALYMAVDLTPLYNKRRALFHIGLDPDTGEASPSYYDLLMSESRMTGYFAIATRRVSKKHWGALSRMLAKSAGYVGPVSWTGTMFEYFMPRLLLPAYEGSMGYEALRFCLHCQKRRPPRGVPWGVSESGFYAFDSNLNYQYKAHGVPRLALKRGMAADLVIAPYATFLTLTTDPEGALRNLSRLERLGMTGRCGFYEAADFTKGRAAGGGYSVVRSYMAHHVGMSMAACANVLLDDVFVRRFLRDGDMARASELLNEQAPVNCSVYDMVKEPTAPELPGRSVAVTQDIALVNPRSPQVHLLSGGEWMLAVSDSGTGVSVCRGMDMTMHSGDLLRRPQGIFTLVDGGEGAFSLTRAPDLAALDNHRATFGDGYAAFFAEKGILSAGLRVMVHPRLPGEQRQLILQNKSAATVQARVLFYFEPCLSRRQDVEAHPAFSRLFLSAHKEEAAQALVVTRRRRGDEPPMCLAAGFLEGAPFEYEADREALLTRPLGTASLPGNMNAPFSSAGSGVPDGAVALRLSLDVPPKGKAALTFVLAAAPTEGEAVTRLVEMRREGRLTAAKAAKSPFGGVEAQLAAQILPDLFYPPRMSREWAQAARENTRGQAALWPLGISGDFPIVLMEVHNAADASRAEPYMRLHRSLQLGGVDSELVILYREGGDYDAPVLEALREAAQAVDCIQMLGARGGIHTVNLMQHGEEAAALLTAVCVHNGARDLQRTGLPPVEYMPISIQPVERDGKITESPRNLLEIPGGRFEGERFVLHDPAGGGPRLPWCHVLANPTFGTLVSDKALGFTWAINARENKLTPWFNDVSSDNRGEMLLLRAGGRVYDTVWGSTPIFGDGYARYEGRAGSLRTAVMVTVPAAGMVKRVTLEIENTAEEETDVQAAYYTEPALGVDRRQARHTVARWEQGALLLRNPFSDIHGGLILTAVGGADGCDCDRGSFLAGNWGGGTLSPIPDPCGAVIVRRRLPPKRRETITFVLGYGAHQEGVMALPRLAEGGKPMTLPAPALDCPDRELAALCSHWLPRQIVTCRLFARTGFYQCGGAWGFRDQLQDTLAALWLRPELTARQLQRCAAVQFEEGDVLHWWHRLPGRRLRGVRTRCSDDLAWLPFVLAAYTEFTGDTGILDVPIPWLTGPALTEEEQERYFEPETAGYRSSLYEHAVRALDKAITHGSHYLPLMGSGDWNDGFNRVGAEGRGESVWLAMFLALTLTRFSPICRGRQDEERARRYEAVAEGYRQAAESCFDGDRYLRAYLDDGTPLGREGAGACAIDSLSQSFAVLCGLNASHTGTALDTALRQLEDGENGLLKLFAPPFGQPDKRVGYTSSYPAGVRENGGQYTHAAAWLAIALFEAGRPEDGTRVLRLLNTIAKYTDGLGEKYRGEPYALAGDVYANPACPGRVGWSQYTGAAGWMYTAVFRHLLGLRPRGNAMDLQPCLPVGWPGYSLKITLLNTPLSITVAREEAKGLTVDGKEAQEVPLDGKRHKVHLNV